MFLFSYDVLTICTRFAYGSTQYGYLFGWTHKWTFSINHNSCSSHN